MLYAEYNERRDALMAEAQARLDSGDMEAMNEKLEEVRALDNAWDANAEAQANLNALSEGRRTLSVQNLTGETVGSGVLTGTMLLDAVPANNVPDGEKLLKSDAYKNAWAKSLMGAKLTAEEVNLVNVVNEYVHTTENTGIVIPESVASGIWDMIEELYPLWDDVQKTYVHGAYKMLIGDDSTDAAWYDEETPTEDGQETIRSLTLNGCELSRSVTISWKLREMAVEDFIPYIQRKLARKIGAALGYGVSHGKGQPSTNDTFKPEPLGIVTALKAEADTPQVATYKAGALSYKDLTAARAKIKVGANELRIYANSTTIWDELANIVDGNGKPIFVPDPVNTGVYRIFGMAVKEDDSMLDGEVLLSSPFVGYAANMNKEMSVMTEEHVKARTVDYCAYAIVDGGVTSTKAHALLEYESGE